GWGGGVGGGGGGAAGGGGGRGVLFSPPPPGPPAGGGQAAALQRSAMNPRRSIRSPIASPIEAEEAPGEYQFSKLIARGIACMLRRDKRPWPSSAKGWFSHSQG